jgi:hypothetical protein
VRLSCLALDPVCFVDVSGSVKCCLFSGETQVEPELVHVGPSVLVSAGYVGWEWIREMDA